jgi:hypothetical protein
LKSLLPSPLAEALKGWRIRQGLSLQEACEIFCSANINVPIPKMQAWEASEFDPTGAAELAFFSLLHEWHKKLASNQIYPVTR